MISQERRAAPRKSVERLAKIEDPKGSSSCYCLAIEFSDGGVRLNSFGNDVPDEFVLLVSGDGPNGKYRVIWRHGNILGAKMIGLT
jgi:hypothetical protein